MYLFSGYFVVCAHKNRIRVAWFAISRLDIFPLGARCVPFVVHTMRIFMIGSAMHCRLITMILTRNSEYFHLPATPLFIAPKWRKQTIGFSLFLGKMKTSKIDFQENGEIDAEWKAHNGGRYFRELARENRSRRVCRAHHRRTAQTVIVHHQFDLRCAYTYT